MRRDFGVALPLTTLNKAFLCSKNDHIIFCIHGGVLCLWSSYNSAGWETDGKAFVQSIDTLRVAFSSPNAACVPCYPRHLCLCGMSMSETGLKVRNIVSVIDV